MPETKIPAITTTASPRQNGDKIANGNKPPAAVTLVKKIGRKRIPAA